MLVTNPAFKQNAGGDGQGGLAAQGRIRALDGLRGLAALLVLFHHTLQIPTGGYLGVDLFFVLSGFLITSIILDEIRLDGTFHFLRFYARRALRLLPAFAVMLALYAAIRYCFVPDELPIGPRRVIEVLFLANLYHPFIYLNHSWSLSVEWQFYFIWPGVLVVLIRSGLSRRWIAALAVVAVAVLWVARFHFGKDIRIDGLLMGAALAALGGPSGGTRSARRWTVIPLALSAVLILVFVSDYQGSWLPSRVGFICVPLLCVGMLRVAATSSSRLDRILLCNPVLLYFGRISYGLYLYHFPVAATMYARGYSPTAMMIVGLIVTIPLADFSWRNVESPLLRLGRQAGAVGIAARGRAQQKVAG